MTVYRVYAIAATDELAGKGRKPKSKKNKLTAMKAKANQPGRGKERDY